MCEYLCFTRCVFIMNPSFFVHKCIFFIFTGMIHLIGFIYTVYFCSIFINSKIVFKR